jgi:hypothetical protein
LPKTADGVEIVPGMKVWCNPPYCANPTGFGFLVLSLNYNRYVDECSERDTKYSDCYSTREAVEAARKESER